MNILKHWVHKILRRFGFSITRISQVQNATPLHTDNTALTKRRIATAYYKNQPFQCFLDDCIGQYILTGKGWDNQLPALLTQLSNEHTSGDIVEIGANIGASFVPITQQFPHFQFHCVEPVPDFQQLLKQNIAYSQSQNIQFYPAAISANVGDTIQIHTQIGTAGAIAEYDGHTAVNAITLQTTTIDTLFANKALKLLKIDVDGFEHQVLRGAQHTLQQQQPWLFMEFHAHLMDKMGVDPEQITAQLQHAGYNDLFAWDNVGRTIGKIASFDELIQQARQTPCYLDVLFRCT